MNTVPPCEEKEQNPVRLAVREVEEAVCNLGRTINELQDEAENVRDDCLCEPYVASTYKRGWATGVEYATLVIDEARTRVLLAIDAAFEAVKQTDG